MKEDACFGLKKKRMTMLKNEGKGGGGSSQFSISNSPSFHNAFFSIMCILIRTPGKLKIPPTPTSKLSQDDKNNLMIPPTSKNRHLLILNNLKKREDNWNQRFHLDQIPPYNAVEEGFVNKVVQRKNQNLVPKEVKIEFAPGKIRKRMPGDPNTPLSIRKERPESVGVNARAKPPRMEINRNQQFIRKKPQPSQGGSTSNNGEANDHLKAQMIFEELEQRWEEFNIEPHHREIFKYCCKNLPVRRSLEILLKEKEDITKKRAPIQGCQQAVKAREACLKHILEVNREIETAVDSQKLKDCIEKSSELLTHIRILSLNVVENIIKWRKSLLDILALSFNYNETMKQAIIISYLTQQKNYLLKMKKDLNFLAHSPLSQYYKFSNNNDPFLLAPTSESKDEKNEKLNHFISKNLYQRIRACELVIVEESVSNKIVNKATKSASSRPLNQLTPSKIPTEQKHLSGGTHALDSLSAYPENDDEPYNRKPDSKQGSRMDNIYNHKDSPSKQSIGDVEDLYARPNLNEQIFDKDSPKQQKPRVSSQQDIKILQQDDSPKETQQVVQQKRRVQQSGRQSKDQVQEKRVLPGNEKNEEPTLDVSQLMGNSDVGGLEELIIEEGKVYEDELKNYLEAYLKNISPITKDSFNIDPDVLVSKAEDEQETGVFEFFAKKDKKRAKKIGIAIVNVEKSFSQYRRLSIMHLSVLNDDMLEQAVKLLFNFLIHNDCCEEIRVSLYHVEDPETKKLDVNKNLKKYFADLGFKWKMVTNDSYTNKRNTIFSFRRPPDTSIIRKYPHQLEPISLKSCVIISSSDFELKDVKLYKEAIIGNLASVTNTVKKFVDLNKTSLDAEIYEDPDAQRLIKMLEHIKQRGDQDMQFPAMRHTVVDSGENLSSFFTNNSFNDPKINFSADNPLKVGCSLMNACYRWSNFIGATVNVDGRSKRYIRTKPIKEEEFLCLHFEDKPPIYIIPTEDDQLKIFVSQANAFLKVKSEQDINMQQYLEKIFKGNNQEPFKEDIWIPVFKKELDFHHIEYLEGHLGISKAVQNLTISTNYPSQNDAIIKIRNPLENSILIKPPFIFGMIHTEIDEKLDMPLFYALIEDLDCFDCL